MTRNWKGYSATATSTNRYKLKIGFACEELEALVPTKPTFLRRITHEGRRSLQLRANPDGPLGCPCEYFKPTRQRYQNIVWGITIILGCVYVPGVYLCGVWAIGKSSSLSFGKGSDRW